MTGAVYLLCLVVGNLNFPTSVRDEADLGVLGEEEGGEIEDVAEGGVAVDVGVVATIVVFLRIRRGSPGRGPLTGRLDLLCPLRDLKCHRFRDIIQDKLCNRYPRACSSTE